MPPIRMLAVLPLVAACAQVPVSLPGAGAAGTRPEAAVRAVETTGRTGRRVLGLTQGTVRACSGAYDPPSLTSPTRTTALSCTGGVTGTATVGPDLLGGRTVRWRLDTGESGRVRL